MLVTVSFCITPCDQNYTQPATREIHLQMSVELHADTLQSAEELVPNIIRSEHTDTKAEHC